MGNNSAKQEEDANKPPWWWSGFHEKDKRLHLATYTHALDMILMPMPLPTRKGEIPFWYTSVTRIDLMLYLGATPIGLPVELFWFPNLTALSIMSPQLNSLDVCPTDRKPMLPPWYQKDRKGFVFPFLEDLHLACNSLTNVDSLIDLTPSLTRLELSGRLTHFPSKIVEGISSLRHLRLDGNPIASLPDHCNRLCELDFLSIQSTGITSIPPNLFVKDVPAYLALDLSGNSLHFSFLTEATEPKIKNHLGIYKATILDDLEFSPFYLLQSINFSECNLDRLPRAIFTISTLRSLTLQNCDPFPEIPEFDNPMMVACQTSLTELNLNHSTLQIFPPVFLLMTNLVKLLAMSTKLSHLPPNTFLCFPKLQELNLFGTPLTEFPSAGLQNLSSLTTLHLRGCDRMNSALPGELLAIHANLRDFSFPAQCMDTGELLDTVREPTSSYSILSLVDICCGVVATHEDRFIKEIRTMLPAELIERIAIQKRICQRCKKIYFYPHPKVTAIIKHPIGPKGQITWLTTGFCSQECLIEVEEPAQDSLSLFGGDEEDY